MWKRYQKYKREVPENKQRFSIRKYAIGAASVLIGFAFQAQAVDADGVVPATTEN